MDKLLLITSFACLLCSCNKPKIEENIEPEKPIEETIVVNLKDISGVSVRVSQNIALDTLVLAEDLPEGKILSYSLLDMVASEEASTVASISEEGILEAKADGYARLIVSLDGKELTSIPVYVQGKTYIQQLDALTKPLVATMYDPAYDSLHLAHGETASLQLLVRSSSFTAELQPRLRSFELIQQQGEAVNRSELTQIDEKFYWLRDVKCTAHWDQWAGGAPDVEHRLPSTQGDMYPDVLMPVEDYAKSLGSGKFAALWLEFDIPGSLQAGLYKGVVELTGGANVASYTFFVRVYDVELPQEQGLTVVQWLNTDLRSMNGGVETDMYKSYDLIENVIIPFMNDYGQNAYRLMYATRVNTTSYKVVDGEPVFDLSLYEREIEMILRSCPKLKAIHGQTAFAIKDDGSMPLIGYKLDADGRPELNSNGQFEYVYTDNAQGITPETAAYIGPYFRQLEALLRSHKLADGRSWLDIFAQSLKDEPKDAQAPAYNVIGKFIKTVAPGIKIIDAIETGKIDQDAIDYPCPTLKMLPVYRATGDQTQWMYTCMQPQGNYANRFIRQPLIKTRILHWVNFLYDAPGYLHWGLNYWEGSNPSHQPLTGDANGSFLGGDSYIIYPGEAKVYPSIRLCAMRDGIRDYDLLRMVEARDAAAALDYAHRLASDNRKHSLDIAAFRALRREILEYLEKK